MKRLFAILLVAVMMCSILSATAFAGGSPEVISPEHGDDPDPDPVSPQTDAAGWVGASVVVLACGSVAVMSARKAREYRS